MENEKKYELIEGLLSNSLEGKDLTEAESLLKDDPTFKAEVDLHQELSERLKGEKFHQFRDVLKNVDQDWDGVKDKKETKVRRLNIRNIAAIAATLLIVLIAYQIFKPSNSLSPQILATNLTEAYPMVLQERSENTDSRLIEAITAYQSKEYVSAASAFQSLNQEQENLSFQFYGAVAQLLSNEDPQKAISAFNNILSVEGNSFTEQSRWYLALAYIQNGDDQNSKNTLNQIRADQFNFESAQKILKEFN